jgi:DNA-binding NarL/FixJ family response regulator
VKVLVIDPSPLLRGRLVRLIAGMPQADVVVASGHGNWTPYLRRLAPDLVILEAGGRRGGRFRPTLATIRRIRRRHGRPSVLVLTNQVTAQHRRSCLAAGADLFLDKSLDLEQVPGLLRTLARRRVSARVPAFGGAGVEGRGRREHVASARVSR